MKKSRIFATAGALALVIAGVFASKANKKFTSVSVIYYTTDGINYTSITGCTSGILFTNSGTGKTFFLSTSGGSLAFPLYYLTGTPGVYSPVQTTNAF